MRKLLLLLLLVFPLSALAVPTGCFVEDGSNNCSSRAFEAADCNQSNMDSYSFGNYVSSMCSYINSLESDTWTWSDLYNDMKSQRDYCYNTSFTMETNRQDWIAYGKYQAKLAKRLRRVCGARCRKIQ
jgi:hypothetical protein